MMIWFYKQKSRKNEGIFHEWMTKPKLKNIKKFWQLSENERHLAFFDTECLCMKIFCLCLYLALTVHLFSKALSWGKKYNF